MFTPSQLMIYAAIGALIAIIIMRAEDKFNNKQYTRGQYIQAAIAGFLITLVPVWLLSRSAEAINGIPAPAAVKPMNAPAATPQPPASSTAVMTGSGQTGGGASAFFTPIVNAITPKMQYRTTGPTF